MTAGVWTVTLTALAMTGAACYQPTVGPCVVRCDGPGSPCPGATQCGEDSYCHAAGEALCPVAGDAGPDATPDATPDAGDGGADPLLTGCVVHLPMDEASWSGVAGEVADACGDDDRGTATAGTTTVAAGVSGRAGEFTGGESCVRIADRGALSAGAALTISAWLYPTALNGTSSFGIVSKRIDLAVEAEYSLFVWSGDRVFVDIDGENDRFGGNVALVNGAWQQVTVVYEGALPGPQRVRVYIDGALDVTAAETSAAGVPFGADLFVGCLPVSTPTQGFVGKLDEVVIWRRALSSVEVDAWYQQTRP